MNKIPKISTKAVILSAGQGRRLLPLTKNSPKCLLPISGKPIIEWQIDALLASGIEEIIVVTGFQTNLVEKLLQQRYPNHKQIKTLFNPFFEVADNLASCWVARSVMDCDFLLLNGDTIFDVPLLAQVLESESAPITLSIDYKKAGRFNDELDIETSIDKIGASRVDLTQNIMKNSDLYTSAKVSIACIHSETFKPQRIPKLIKQQMEIL